MYLYHVGKRDDWIIGAEADTPPQPVRVQHPLKTGVSNRSLVFWRSRNKPFGSLRYRFKGLETLSPRHSSTQPSPFVNEH